MDNQAAITVIIGGDGAAVNQQSLAQYQQWIVKEDNEWNAEIINGLAEEKEAAYQVCLQVAQSLETLDLFGSGRVIWLKQANFLTDQGVGKSQRVKEGIEILEQALQKGLPDGTRFLLSTQQIDKRKSFYKLLKKIANLQAFDCIDMHKEGWQESVKKQLSKKASARNLTFDPQAAELFVSRVGVDTIQMNLELEKIELFFGQDKNKVVNSQIVQSLVPVTRESVIFEISRTIQYRQSVEAWRLIQEQLAQEDNAISLLRVAIIPAVRQLLFAKLLAETYHLSMKSYRNFETDLSNLSSQILAWLPKKKSGEVSAYPIFLAMKPASSFKLNELKKALKACLKVDRALVSSSLDGRWLLDCLIAEIIA